MYGNQYLENLGNLLIVQSVTASHSSGLDLPQSERYDYLVKSFLAFHTYYQKNFSNMNRSADTNQILENNSASN